SRCERAADHRAHAGAGDAVDRHAQFLQHLEHAQMRGAAGAATGEGEADLRARGRRLPEDGARDETQDDEAESFYRGSPSRIRREKSSALSAAIARELIRLRRCSSANGRLVSSLPWSYSSSGTCPLTSSFHEYGRCSGLTRECSQMLLVQFVISVL